MFDKQYKLLHEESVQLDEIKDEDGFPSEDVAALTKWVEQKFSEILSRSDIEVRGVNFSTYGASFVHLDENLKPATPLYNYLKPYPDYLRKQFYDRNGGEDQFARVTASPVLGSLNSGMQLYRLKYEKPAVYEKIKCSLHLPQYLSFVFTRAFSTDISSVGCHTNLWDFAKSQYHEWVQKEGVYKKFAPLYNGDKIIGDTGETHKIPVGIGLHDSSAALIPYLSSFNEPFALISTGTWCISLNPFNHTELTAEELKQDCLCYLSYEGRPVKASRLFAGYEHEQEVKKLAAYFHKADDYYKTVEVDARQLAPGEICFSNSVLNEFNDYEEAYHHLVRDIVNQQIKSTNLVLQGTTVKKIFVDGGFAKNKIYMTMLANAFPGLEIYAAAISQASALGAALAIHKKWNNNPLPTDIIELKRFSNTQLKYSHK